MQRYRILDRELSANSVVNPLLFFTLGCSTNFTDSKLKQRRILCYLLKVGFLHREWDTVDKIIRHLLRTNVERPYDIFAATCIDKIPSRALLSIVCATYLAKDKLSELFQLLASLKDLNMKNTAFQLNVLAHQIAVLIKAK